MTVFACSNQTSLSFQKFLTLLILFYVAERNQSPPVEEGEAALVRENRGGSTDMFEGEEGEFPKENGEPQSNGIGVETRSQKNADKQPDLVDDHPDKSRFTFHFFHTCVVIYVTDSADLVFY